MKSEILVTLIKIHFIPFIFYQINLLQIILKRIFVLFFNLKVWILSFCSILLYSRIWKTLLEQQTSGFLFMQSQNVVLMINKFFPRVILIRIFPFGRPKVFSVLNLIVFSVPLGIFFLSQSIFFLFLFKPRLYIYSIYLFYWYNCKCSCKLCLEGN